MDATAGGTVYVVDDDPSVAAMTARLLASAGHRVETFTSARAFLASGLVTPCCVVLDLEMPERTGLEVQAELARRRPAPPVVFLTGHGTVRSSVEALKAGAADFLEKPAPREELLASVAVALGESARRAAEQAAGDEARRRLSRLTPREREVCALVGEGLPNRDVAARLGTAVKTVKVHRARVKEKLEVSSVAELVRLLERARE